MAEVDWSNYDMANMLREGANQAATQEYYKELSATGSEELALNKAKFAWQQTMDKAGLTGQFEGQWTHPAMTGFANQFGAWGAPTAGQKTLAALNQEAGYTGQYGGQETLQSQLQAANMLGTYQGQQTQAAQQQAFAQQLAAQQEGRLQGTANQQAAQSYLNLLSSLRGPADWAKYQQVLGATPGGLSDLTAAAMGQYIPGGGATTGMRPQAANLQTMYNDVVGAGGAAYGPPGYQYLQGQQPAYQNTLNQFNQAVGRPTQQAAPQPAQQQWNQYQQPQQQPVGQQGTSQLGQLPLPNQIAAQSWKNLTPSQQQLYTGAYEAQGWHGDDVRALMNQALPKYASNAPTAGTYRLR